jgi:hypothetical protein
MEAATPPQGYAGLYGTRGHGAHASQAVQGARQSDRTAATPCLANALRLLLTCAAAILHQAVRRQTWQHTALAPAPPQRSSCPSATWPRRANSPRIAAASTCPVPAPSPRSYTASPPGCLQCLCPRGTRPDASTWTAALDRCRSPAPRPRHHHVGRRGQRGAIDTPLGGEVRAFFGADPPSPR